MWSWWISRCWVTGAALLVALAAGEGNLQRRDRRVGVRHRLDVVHAVAVRAARGERVAPRRGPGRGGRPRAAPGSRRGRPRSRPSRAGCRGSPPSRPCPCGSPRRSAARGSSPRSASPTRRARPCGPSRSVVRSRSPWQARQSSFSWARIGAPGQHGEKGQRPQKPEPPGSGTPLERSIPRHRSVSPCALSSSGRPSGARPPVGHRRVPDRHKATAPTGPRAIDRSSCLGEFPGASLEPSVSGRAGGGARLFAGARPAGPTGGLDGQEAQLGAGLLEPQERPESLPHGVAHVDKAPPHDPRGTPAANGAPARPSGPRGSGAEAVAVPGTRPGAASPDGPRRRSRADDSPTTRSRAPVRLASMTATSRPSASAARIGGEGERARAAHRGDGASGAAARRTPRRGADAAARDRSRTAASSRGGAHALSRRSPCPAPRAARRGSRRS